MFGTLVLNYLKGLNILFFNSSLVGLGAYEFNIFYPISGLGLKLLLKFFKSSSLVAIPCSLSVGL